MRLCFLILSLLIALSNGQKPKKIKSSDPPPTASSESFSSHTFGDNPYEAAIRNVRQQHGGSHGHGQTPYAHVGASHHPGASTGKNQHTFPQILQDQRTLNHDGSINFKYSADNGLQQGESVDPDGTRRGFYSYIGADGKPLTVRYSAGKNGFVAEGDHLPKQPNVPAHSEKDEVVSKTGGSPYNQIGGGHKRPSYHQQQHQPYSHSSPQYPQYPSHHQSHEHEQPSHSHYRNPSPYSGGGHSNSNYDSPPSFASYNENPYPRAHYSPREQAPSYSFGASSPHSGGGGGGAGHYSNPYSSEDYSGSPQGQYSHSLAARSPQYHSPSAGHSQHRNTQPAAPFKPYLGFGPYKENFDLGNGGQFSINFQPGETQPYSGQEPDYNQSQQTQKY